MSKKCFIPTFVVAFCAALCAQPVAPVSAEEVLVLLRAGVQSQEIESLIARRGGPGAVTEADLDATREAGGSSNLLKTLEKRLEVHAALRDLARSHDTWTHKSAGVSFIYPRGWVVSPEIHDDGALVTIQRDPAGPRDWFRTPRLFVWVQRGTPFPSSSQPELAGKVAQFVGRRLGRAGMSPREIEAGLGKIGGKPCPEHRIFATVPKLGFDGTLLLRTRVFRDGTVVSIGYACGQGDEEPLRELFAPFVDSFALSRE